MLLLKQLKTLKLIELRLDTEEKQNTQKKL